MQFVGLPWSTILFYAGLSAALITALYVLKLRKRRVQVPFSPIWQKVLDDNKSVTDL